jgi:hypothetical protein
MMPRRFMSLHTSAPWWYSWQARRENPSAAGAPRRADNAAYARASSVSHLGTPLHGSRDLAGATAGDGRFARARVELREMLERQGLRVREMKCRWLTRGPFPDLRRPGLKHGKEYLLRVVALDPGGELLDRLDPVAGAAALEAGRPLGHPVGRRCARRQRPFYGFAGIIMGATLAVVAMVAFVATTR